MGSSVRLLLLGLLIRAAPDSGGTADEPLGMGGEGGVEEDGSLDANLGVGPELNRGRRVVLDPAVALAMVQRSKKAPEEGGRQPVS